MRPQPRVRNKTKHTSVVTTVTPEIARHSPRNGFTVSFVLSPATNSFCHRHPRIKVSSMPGWATSLRELDTSNGCQNHTSSPSAALRLSQRLRRAKHRSSACHSSAHGPYDPPCHPLTSPNAAASTASRPRVRDDREPPLCGTGPNHYIADFTPSSSENSENQKLARECRCCAMAVTA